MANKMLIDATHPEETRVVVLRGNRVEEFDFESAHRKQLRGNIYLAKVTRVEPSLQAAFVDYGGNRHGFLAFSEIHPDYYQIPVADRQALIDEEERAQRAAEDEADRLPRQRHEHRERLAATRQDELVSSELAETAADIAVAAEGEITPRAEAVEAQPGTSGGQPTGAGVIETEAPEAEGHEPVEPAQPLPWDAIVTAAAGSQELHPDELQPATQQAEPDAAETESHAVDEPAGLSSSEFASTQPALPEAHGDGAEDEERTAARESETNGDDEEVAEEVVESVGGADALEEVPTRAPRYRRQYKIQEVIKRRQVMLVQVVKEERGSKGAALTTYLSLAGRYSVLMPNTARGGGISRKITNAEDRARLKEAAQELDVPEGMGVILRTAGANRTKLEIKRDFEYLMRLWETVRDLTLKSTAPKLVYEEGSLVKRSIRDLYGKDIDEVIVAGVDAYHEAKDFMRMLMPSHAKNVRLYADTQPLLSRYGVESQLDAMFSPVVQLRSGGYIVLNQAEALVAIDVNSGRATREHHIEDTALKTNLEAADEIARQLRLRDLAGLIVIDFIDMEENRNNRAVERRLKECLKQDRARIQVGRISHFGLLEMSRQRIRASVLESSTEKCAYCGGSGHVRSVSSLALQVLRALEEQLIKGATHNLIARTRPDVALYVLNQKRAHLRALEERFAITITISADESILAPQTFVIDRGEQIHTIEAARALAEQQPQPIAAPLEEEDDLELAGAAEVEAVEEAAAVEAEPAEEGQRRRRRRRRRGGRGGEAAAPAHEHAPSAELANGQGEEIDGDAFAESDTLAQTGEAEVHHEGDHAEPRHEGERRRRRGRRGGRRNRRERNGDLAHVGHADRDYGDLSHGQEMSQHEEVSHGQEFAAPAPENSFTPPEQPAFPATAEPELAEAVADLDSAPAAGAITFEPERPAEVSVEAEPPRRRSTVRERAPTAGPETPAEPATGPTPSPAPQPVITEIDSGDNADRPRRSGWWSRRFAG